MSDRLPHIVVADIGGTNSRFGIFTPEGNLLADVVRLPTPGANSLPDLSLVELQQHLLDMVASQVDAFRQGHAQLDLRHVAIAIGVAISNDGIVKDASILWRRQASGFDLLGALRAKLPGVEVWIQNDLSGMAWRHHRWERFAIYTVSTGLSCKVYDVRLAGSNKLALDEEGLAGELGHVTVNPEPVAAACAHARRRASEDLEAFRNSQLSTLVASPDRIESRDLGVAAKQGDEFACQLLAEAGVPYCECGNLADLCSYTSGPSVVRLAQGMARADRAKFENSGLGMQCQGKIENIDTYAIAKAARDSDPLTEEILGRGTYFLALSILQLCALLGLKHVIIAGGFANGVGKPYFEALHGNLVDLAFPSGFFASWTEADFRSLVIPSEDTDQDAMIGMGYWLQAQLRGSE